MTCHELSLTPDLKKNVLTVSMFFKEVVQKAGEADQFQLS